MKNCPQCGRTMEDGLDYCPDCGKDVSDITRNNFPGYDDSDFDDDDFDDRNYPDKKFVWKKREGKKKKDANLDNPEDTGYTQDYHDKKDPVTLGGWLLTFLVMMLPIVSLVMPFVWAFGNSQPSKKNWARASLIMSLISLLLVGIMVLTMGGLIKTVISDVLGGENSSLQGVLEDDNNEDAPTLAEGDEPNGSGDDPFGLSDAEGNEGTSTELGALDFSDATTPNDDEGITLNPSSGVSESGSGDSSATPSGGTQQMNPAPNDGAQQGLTPNTAPGGSASTYQDVINALSQSSIYTMQALTPDVSIAFGSFMMLTDSSGNSYACAAVKVKNTGSTSFRISDTLFINALQNGNSLAGGAYAAIYEETEGASFYKAIQPGAEEIVFLGYPTTDTSSPVTITIETWDTESSVASQTFDLRVI